MTWQEDPRLHIAVISGIDDDDDDDDEAKPFDVREELRLVKAALLYADDVTLVTKRKWEFEWQREAVVQGADNDWVQPAINQLSQDLGNRQLAVRAVERDLEEEWTKSGAADLERAIVAGVLRIEEPSGRIPTESIGDILLELEGKRPTGRMYQQWAEELLGWLSSVVEKSASTYPMFDERVTGLLSRAADFVKDVPPEASASTEPYVAAAVLGRMEGFPTASVDEILDLRRDLASPLVQFRSAIAGMARELETTPIDRDFRRVADAMYRETVRPALEQLEALQSERGYRQQLRRQVLEGSLVPDKTTLMLATAALWMLPSLSVAAAGVALNGITSGSKLALAIAQEREKLSKDRRTNRFVFLADAEARLRKRRR
jgi:hypothetical protein